MSKIKLNATSGGGSVSLQAPSTASSDTVLEVSSYNTVLDNTPSWLVKLSSNYTHSSTNSWQIAPLATEDHDTDGAFNTTTYKFTVPSGKAGKYFLYYHQQISDNPDDGENMQGKIEKNGTALDYSYSIAFSVGSNKTTNIHHSFVTTLAVGDELAMWLYHHEGGSVTYSAGSTWFGGYRLIGG